MWKNAKWIGIPREEIRDKQIFHGDLGGRFACFRCDKELPAGCTLSLDITANSRYRLWINGEPVLSGPCKGDRQRQYYETVDVTNWLHAGHNVFCAQVLYCDPDMVESEIGERAAIYGVVGRQCGHRLAIEGVILDSAGEMVETITTGLTGWRVWLDNSYFLKSDEHTQFLGAVIEQIDAGQTPIHWREADFDCVSWRPARVFEPGLAEDPLRLVGVTPLFRLRKREIPLLYERRQGFVRCFDRAGNDLSLLSAGSMEVRAGDRAEILLDAGAILNAYPCFHFNGGRGAKVEITYFEKFGGPGSDTVRSDVRGEVEGITDTIALDGSGLCFEPFWVRTFRFVLLKVETAESPVTVYAPQFNKTGYPLPVESHVESSEPWVARLWEICVRTLENCMLETYLDCPYYEQLQYGMDTRLEAQYTYAVSRDAALVRKALLDFHYGMQPEGLNAGKAPSAYLQILSTFSLHYIFLLCEYAELHDDAALLRRKADDMDGIKAPNAGANGDAGLLRRKTDDMDGMKVSIAGANGDAGLLRLCRGDIDRILDVFDSRIGPDGLVGRLDYWNFVDWNDAWNETGGAPAALKNGPSTIINLMYAYALQCAADFMEGQGRTGLASEYREQCTHILSAVEGLCWDEEAGLYREGPDFQQFSRHAQAWAVLNGLKEGEDAARLLKAALEREDILRCSFSASYEWFRALEKAGLYDDMRKELEPWIELLDLDCTCCPETPKGARSECHAWSALPLYELVRTMAGVKPQKDGRLLIAPHPTGLPDLCGQAATENGMVSFDYKKNKTGKWEFSLTLPAGASGVFRFPNGQETALGEGCQILKEE